MTAPGELDARPPTVVDGELLAIDDAEPAPRARRAARARAGRRAARRRRARTRSGPGHAASARTPTSRRSARSHGVALAAEHERHGRLARTAPRRGTSWPAFTSSATGSSASSVRARRRRRLDRVRRAGQDVVPAAGRERHACIAPAGAREQPRPARDDGRDAARRAGSRARAARSEERLVARARAEQLRPLAPQPQRAARHPELLGGEIARPGRPSSASSSARARRSRPAGGCRGRRARAPAISLPW